MHVAVVIVAFRNPEDVTQCLAALGRSTHAEFEVVICENAGRAAFETLVAASPATLPEGQRVRILEAPFNLGYAGGVNHAMAAAPEADAWWVLNPDTEAEPDALEALVARLSTGDCDAVGCTIYLPDENVQSYGGLWRPAFARAVSLGKGAPLNAAVDPGAVERTQSYLNGACMLMGRQFLNLTGPMREDYFLYCEEVEWCLRGRALGATLGFAPAARVLHHAGTTTGSYRAIQSQPKTPVYLNERNKMLLTRDCFPALLPIAAVGALVLMIARYGRRQAWGQLGYAASGWVAGLLNRRGPPAWIDVRHPAS